jgi:hypothetical protein
VQHAHSEAHKKVLAQGEHRRRNPPFLQAVIRSITLTAGNVPVYGFNVKTELTGSFLRWRNGRTVEESPFNSALLTRKLFTLSTISFIRALFGGRFFRITWKKKSALSDCSDHHSISVHAHTGKRNFVSHREKKTEVLGENMQEVTENKLIYEEIT